MLHYVSNKLVRIRLHRTSPCSERGQGTATQRERTVYHHQSPLVARCTEVEHYAADESSLLAEVGLLAVGDFAQAVMVVEAGPIHPHVGCFQMIGCQASA